MFGIRSSSRELPRPHLTTVLMPSDSKESDHDGQHNGTNDDEADDHPAGDSRNVHEMHGGDPKRRRWSRR
jgi:hypothetical protein